MTTPAPRIMIVYSERAIADTITTILKQFGHDCVTAYHGQQAVDRAREIHPQLILMEVVMLGILGTDAAKIILDEQPECKIVLSSGSNLERHYEDMKKKGYELEIVAFPMRPVEIVNLLTKYGYPPSTIPEHAKGKIDEPT